MEIVTDEWLLDYMDYMRPDSKEYETNLALKFINAWVRKCDKLVVRVPSPFITKFYHLMNKYKTNLESYERFKKLHRLLLLNSDKTVIMYEHDIITLPEELAEKAPRKDKYLVELAYSSADKTILTTDKRLKEALQSVLEFRVHLLEEFAKNYLL